MNVMICWGEEGLGRIGFFSICEEKDNKQNSKGLFLKHPHVRLLEFACLNRVPQSRQSNNAMGLHKLHTLVYELMRTF